MIGAVGALQYLGDLQVLARLVLDELFEVPVFDSDEQLFFEYDLRRFLLCFLLGKVRAP